MACWGSPDKTVARATETSALTKVSQDSTAPRSTFRSLPTDECMWAWQTDPDIPQITMINWNSSSVRVQWAYTRLTYDITLFNSYLSQVPEDEANRQYRAEVRFLRALHYWYMLDLFGKSPFKTEFNITELPIEYSGNQMYGWLDKEPDGNRERDDRNRHWRRSVQRLAELRPRRPRRSLPAARPPGAEQRGLQRQHQPRNRIQESR